MVESRPTPTEPAAEAEPDTRRATPRFPCRHVTFFRPVSSRERDSELAGVQDISVAGIGLLVRSPIKRGAILIVELNSTLRSVRHQRLARVTHVTDQGNGYLLLGCEFASRLTEPELHALTH